MKLSSAVVERVRAVYALRQRGGITDAEARWILDMLLFDCGMTVEQLARVLAGRAP